MRYLEYRERRTHGTFDFPVAFYHITSRHPRYQMVAHWHAEYEVIRVLAGCLRLELDGRELRLGPGDLAFVAEGVLHGGTPGEGCCYECVVFDLNLLLGGSRACARELEPILSGERRVGGHFPAGEDKLRPLADGMFDSLASREAGYQLRFVGALCGFLGALCRETLRGEERGQSPRDQRKLRSFKAVLAYIWDNYQEDVGLEELAGRAGMNPKYFCRFFKEMTGQTPVEYLNYYRVECACERLAATSGSITEVALSCGFNDVSYFAKVFRRFKGVSPSQYLKGEEGQRGKPE